MMATIKDLRIPSILQMSFPDLIEHLRQIRRSRIEVKKVKKETKPRQKKEKKDGRSLIDIISSMTPEMKRTFLANIQKEN